MFTPPQQPQQPQLTPQAQIIDMGELSRAFVTVCIRVYNSELSPSHRVTDLDVHLLASLSSAIQAVHALQKANVLAQHQEEKGRSVIAP